MFCWLKLLNSLGSFLLNLTIIILQFSENDVSLSGISLNKDEASRTSSFGSTAAKHDYMRELFL